MKNNKGYDFLLQIQYFNLRAKNSFIFKITAMCNRSYIILSSCENKKTSNLEKKGCLLT